MISKSASSSAWVDIIRNFNILARKSFSKHSFKNLKFQVIWKCVAEVIKQAFVLLYMYDDIIYTLSVLMCRAVVTHTYTISAWHLLSEFISLLLSLNYKLLIPMTLFNTASHSVLSASFDRWGSWDIESWSSFHKVIQQDSSKTKNKRHGRTAYLWDRRSICAYKYYIHHHSSYLI